MGEVTFSDLERHAATTPLRSLRFKAMLWSIGGLPDYAQFVDVVQQATALACNDLARNPSLHANKKEDELTDWVAAFLRGMGFDASFDSRVGGHCDLVVKLHDEYLWLAEAKINTSHSWVWQGYEQLRTRYQPGDPNSTHGGMLIYCYKADTSQQMVNWKTYMIGQDPALTFSVSSLSRLAGMFESQHVSPRTGVLQTVTHFPVPLHWAPAGKTVAGGKVKKAVVTKRSTKKVAKAKPGASPASP